MSVFKLPHISSTYNLYFTRKIDIIEKLAINNVTDRKLKEAAGADKSQGLRGKAETLYQKANKLATEMGVGAPGKAEASALANEVGENEEKGIRNALKALAEDSSDELKTKADAVKTQYNTVKELFEAVKQKNEENKYADYPTQYQAVEKAWNAFNNAKKYDIQNDTAQPGLKEKATELQGKATELKEKARELKEKARELQSAVSAGTVTNAATRLATNAEALNTDAGKITGGGLDALHPLASQLATAAGTTSTSGLAKAAEDLKTAQTDYDKAKEVITAFSKVKDAHENLAKHQKYKQPPTSEQRKVKAVETAWTNVKTDFEALCKALIKHFAGEIATNARDLASGTDKSSEVINSFEVVDSSYNQLDDKSSLKSEFNTVKQIYDRILNLTKLKKKATKLQQAADALAGLRDAAGTLETTVTNLRDDTTDAQTNAKTVVTNFNDVKDKFYELTEDQKKNVKDKFEALKTVYDHIIIHYPKILQNAAGENENDQGKLRALAGELYTKAEALNSAVIASNLDAAKVLKHKAGDDSKKEDPKYLRKLAANLHEKASQLAQAVQSAASSGVNDEGAASSLAAEVGASESDGKLRQKLKELAEHDDGSQPGKLPTKASAVTQKYQEVSGKFEAVKRLKDSAYKNFQTQYEAVEKAWNAFNNVYKPEEQLKDAVGEHDAAGIDGQPTTLRQALQQLANASILSPGVHKKAEDVKTQYNTVKSKFELVKKQATEYGADGSNIKDQKYTPVETAFNDFNKLYREAIYNTKFY